MMNYLTPNVPEMFEKFYSHFDSLFSETSQRDNFRLYGTGLLLEIKRKNIQSICCHIISANYQSMHHFIHDSPWDENWLNDQRIVQLENTKQTKSCASGYVIIDDTGNPKSGPKTFATRRQWIGSLGKVDNGQVVVSSHYADKRKDWPIDLRPYLPQEWVEEQNALLEEQTYVFKSKLKLGLELIDDVQNRKIQFSHLLIDSWYGNSPDFITGVEERNCLYITPLYANRRVYIRLPGDNSASEHPIRDLVTVLPDDAFAQIRYTKANGEVCTVYVMEINLRIKNLPDKRRIMIVKPTPQEKNMERIDVFMTNDSKNPIPFILHSWSFRDKIDKFYERGKDELGFDQYQVRDDRSIRRHWYMVFLMYSFIIRHRQCGSFRKWCTNLCQTFGDLLSTLRAKLMLHFQKWCFENQPKWQQFLQEQKGIPMTAYVS
jgi:hypothetical protein